MSLPEQEARAMRRAWEFLLHLRSGEIRIDGHITKVRKEAGDIVKHFPLGGDLEAAARRYAPELLGKVEREADQLAQEAAREAARADELEKRYGEQPIPDSLNIP